MTNPDANLPPQGDPETGGIPASLWQVIRRDRMLSIILAGTIALVLIAAQLVKSGVSADGLQATLGVMIGPLLVVILIMLVLGSLRKTFLGTALTILVLIYLTAGLKQFLVPDLPPKMPPFHCFFSMRAEGCPGSPKYTTNDLARSEPEAVEPLEPTSDAFVPEPLISPGPVFLQFAGSLQRESIIELAMALAAEGWNMQGADRGGERTAAAAGINEVRFFHPDDRKYAEALAQILIAKADWVDGMEVRDLSSAGFNPQPGQLEIWTSR